ncbi:coproporphyrinogen dehydrogenase HemZ, partial [Clostridiaceae bacterium UIB06]|nr:coproporphyrinogen dehydrogenase HemZ [Clostridiaceae bacterium UIB06]
EQNELNLMYEKTVELAESLNMKPYYMYRQKNMVGNMENIGYTIEGKEAIYNIQMIEERQTIIACGAGAVTKVVFLDENRLERHFNVKDVREYINRVDEMVQKKLGLLDTLYK